MRMTAEQLVLPFTLLSLTVLGAATFLTNPRRTLNQAFLLFCGIFCGWLASVLWVFGATQPETAAFRIRICSVFGAALPLGLTMLRLAIHSPSSSLWQLARPARAWLGLFLLLALFSFSSL